MFSESLHLCRSTADEKVVAVGVNDSVASCSDSALASGDVTMDSIKEHKYEFDSITQQCDVSHTTTHRCIVSALTYRMSIFHLSVHVFIYLISSTLVKKHW